MEYPQSSIDHSGQSDSGGSQAQEREDRSTGSGAAACRPGQAVPRAHAAPQAHAGPQIVLPKNPALGVILSFFIPGLGSIVNGDVGRGAIILGVYAVGWILTLVLIGIPILIGAFIWGMADGYLSAQRWNQAHGIVS